MRTIPLILTALLLMNFTIKDKGYVIKGTTKNIPQGEMIYLKVLDPNTNSFNAIDSTRLKNDRFQFKGSTTYPSYALLELSKDATEIVVLEDGEIVFTYDYNDELGTSTTGTKNNNQLNYFHNSIKKVQKEANKYRDDNQDILTKAITDNDQVVLERLSSEFKVYISQINDIITTQLKDYSDSFTSAVILYQRLDNKNIDPKEAKTYYDRYKENIKHSNIGLGIKKLLETPPETSTLVKVGDKAIDVSGQNQEGKEISLYNSLGKVTLLHFWAPWCPSCHETLPIIRNLYQEFHAQGLNIFSIALDEDKQEWIDTIAKEKLNWNHIANLYEIQIQYGVKNIPTVFVLDKNGKVIDINHLDNNVSEIIQQELNRQ
ncbi:TlpA disulfide reductase family protein [Myroides marinus]|uniref:TlpA disulfide reductase family protein n=1 Tax=Myroides marinus TaxID=703342 RepID=UPI002575EA04|nr:TlpA disulfide reductase family protein [Myroides marinus]MDM1379831.1 AhpC/TSA family protein [Myroides marinus]MDM1387112.1 AhpC/TSA family protein [Myroides marinus]MDM1394315.1 AhpC/TSA family protein [Myroides marinus]